MPAYLNLDLLENPYGKRVGGGYDTVRVGPAGGRLHIKAPDGTALCMQGRKQMYLRGSTGRVVDCYRCIKIMGMNSNAPYVRRELTTAKGEKKSHYMLPGGRQGQLVADKKASPGGMDGVPTFKRGPKNHPTQPWMTKRIAMAKSYAERLSDEGVALPPYFLPQTFEEMEIAQESSFYESPGAIAAVAAAGRRVSREAAAARRADRAAAAAAAAKQVANPYRGRRNPRMTLEEAEAVMLRYHSGQPVSAQEAGDADDVITDDLRAKARKGRPADSTYLVWGRRRSR